MKKTKRFYAVGKDGTIIDIFTDPVMASRQGKSKTPVFEFIPAKTTSFRASKTVWAKLEGKEEQVVVKRLAQRFYRRHGIYGSYGDVIQISRYNILGKENCYMYTADSIMARAFSKPGLAADLVPFVCDTDGNLFFVGIIRGKNPGKGKIALVGGFVDISGYKMETAAECSTREGEEEIGLTIIPAEGEGNRFFLEPNADYLRTRVRLADMKTSSLLRLVGTFFTSDDEKQDKVGLKRIYQTTAYTLLIPVNRELIKDDVATLFRPDDDAAEVVVVPHDQFHRIEFAFSHHTEIFAKAVGIIEAEYGSM